MKILYLADAMSVRVYYGHHSLRRAIAKVADVEIIEKSVVGIPLVKSVQMMMGGKLKNKKVLDPQYANKFDAVFTDSMYYFLNEEWENVKVPTVQLIEDVSGPLWKTLVLASNEKKLDLTAYRYKGEFLSKAKPLLKHGKTFWSPHGVDTSICYDYREPKIYDAMHLGQVGRAYPIRQAIVKQLRDKAYFKRIVRPAEDWKNTAKWPTKQEYAKLVSQSKICLTCSTKFQRPVMKYTEIPACNTLLIADYLPELQDLGIKDGLHMVTIDTGDIAGQVEYWLKNQDKREHIARNGMAFITKYHNIDVRARDLVDFIKKEL